MPKKRRIARRKRFGKNVKSKLLYGNVEFRFSNPDLAVDWKKDISDLDKRVNDLTPVWRRFGEYYERTAIPNAFSREGRGKKWAKLKPATELDRIRQGYGGASPILQRTKKLMQGFKTAFTKKTFKVENPVSYADVHQYGSRRRNIPARKVLEFINVDKSVFSRFFNQYIKGKLK